MRPKRRPRTAIVSAAAKRAIAKREARERSMKAVSEWRIVGQAPEDNVYEVRPAHVTEAMKYVIAEDSNDVEIIR
jgi:hypothetical protein